MLLHFGCENDESIRDQEFVSLNSRDGRCQFS